MKKKAASGLGWVPALVLGVATLAVSLPASAAKCENGQIDQAVKEVAGREPHAAECKPERWGCWQSYGELRGRVYREIGLPPGTVPATQKLLRNSWDRTRCPAEDPPAQRHRSRSNDSPPPTVAKADPAAARAVVLMLLLGSYVSR